MFRKWPFEFLTLNDSHKFNERHDTFNILSYIILADMSINSQTLDHFGSKMAIFKRSETNAKILYHKGTSIKDVRCLGWLVGQAKRDKMGQGGLVG